MSPPRARPWLGAAVLAGALGWIWFGGGHPWDKHGDGGPRAVAREGFLFVDVAAQAGLREPMLCGSPAKDYILETDGSGAALFDYDGDDDLDLYLVNGSTMEAARSGTVAARNRLYRNDGPGPDGVPRFRDVTDQAGVGDPSWGMAAAVGDVDNDGDPDLYVCNWGPNVLYLNQGDGRFQDVSAAAGVADPGWSCAAAFLDADGDGLLDLYVVDYLDFDLADPVPAGGDPGYCYWKGIPVACSPSMFPAQPDVFYRNLGRGRFLRAEAEFGLDPPPARGMGLAVLDADADGDPDLYVTNDVGPNFLFLREWSADGRPRYREAAHDAGVARGADGSAQGSMGAACADLLGDGFPWIFVTNFDEEPNVLYANRGGTFAEAGPRRGLGLEAVPMVSWGAGFADLDLDGELDLHAVNGHTVPRAPQGYHQPDLLYRGLGGGRFLRLDAAAAGLGARGSSRGAAYGDVDGDGRVDVLVTVMGHPPALLLNRSPRAGHYLSVRLQGVESPADGQGATVVVQAGGRRRTAYATSSGSYECASAHALHFGLGQVQVVDQVQVRWPSGVIDRLENVSTNTVLQVREAHGPVRPTGER